MSDLIDRQKAKDAIDMALDDIEHVTPWVYDHLLNALNEVPSVVHNITMGEVLKYIDNMSEDVWQEFNSCLECRGWNLERVSIAKWCGSEFA